MVTHHPARLGSHKHCGTGDVLKELVCLGKKTLFQLS